MNLVTNDKLPPTLIQRIQEEADKEGGIEVVLGRLVSERREKSRRRYWDVRGHRDCGRHDGDECTCGLD